MRIAYQDQDQPERPPPAQRLRDEAADDGADDGAEQRAGAEHGGRRAALLLGQQVGDGATADGHEGGGAGAAEEAEHQNMAASVLSAHPSAMARYRMELAA